MRRLLCTLDVEKSHPMLNRSTEPSEVGNMPNRTQAGYMPQYEKAMDIKRNTTQTAMAREGRSTIRRRASHRSDGPTSLMRAISAGRTSSGRWVTSRIEPGSSACGSSRRLRLPSPDRAIKTAESRPIQQWTRTDLYYRARELGIPGRSAMTKRRLINALRRADAQRA